MVRQTVFQLENAHSQMKQKFVVTIPYMSTYAIELHNICT